MLPFQIFLTGLLLLKDLLATPWPDKQMDEQEMIALCNTESCRKSREYSAILGRASWTLLHTLTVNYPDHPTDEDKADILQFIRLFGKFYPCKFCSRNFARELETFPPRVDSRYDISMWLCELHNNVNVRLGKPVFDCSAVFDQWQRDPANGYCPDVCPVDFSSEQQSVAEEAVTYIAIDPQA